MGWTNIIGYRHQIRPGAALCADPGAARRAARQLGIPDRGRSMDAEGWRRDGLAGGGASSSTADVRAVCSGLGGAGSSSSGSPASPDIPEHVPSDVPVGPKPPDSPGSTRQRSSSAGCPSWIHGARGPAPWITSYSERWLCFFDEACECCASPNTVQLRLHRCSLGACRVRVGEAGVGSSVVGSGVGGGVDAGVPAGSGR